MRRQLLLAKFLRAQAAWRLARYWQYRDVPQAGPQDLTAALAAVGMASRPR